MKHLFLCFVFCFAVPAAATDRDPQQLLKDADRQLHAGDTAAVLQSLRQCLTDPSTKEWIVEEAMKLFSSAFRAPSDSPASSRFFSLAFHSPRAAPVVPSLLTILMEYPRLTSEEKLSVITGVSVGGKADNDILEARIQLLRRLGRHDPAVELAARLAESSGRLEHRVLVVDLMLDLSRSADAAALSNSILSDAAGDPAAYSMLAERFYRHGDYRNALDIHRRARQVFSNPMLFFDQSLSICQGLQLGREGIELYLPVLLDNASAAPEFYKDFLAMIDTAFLTREYPSWIARGRNPNLFWAAIPRFSEIAPDRACLDFARLYRDKFQDPSAHLGLAEKLLDQGREQSFLAMLADLPDTPAETAESKKILLFKNLLRTAGPDKALEQFPPVSFTSLAQRASAHRLVSQVYLKEQRLTDAIFSLKAAQTLSPEAMDDLRLAQMYFLSGADSEALEEAYRAHRLAPTDETLYWLGWLSYVRNDTETARKAFRDVILRPENFFADESLAWLIAMNKGAALDPAMVGQAMRDAARGRPDALAQDDQIPIAVRLAARRDTLRSGAAGKSLPAGESPFLQYLRWESLDPKDRTEAEYQKLLKDSPEYLRNLIRIEEP